MSLTKFYYRDEPYYYKTIIDENWEYVNNYLRIYVKRTNWLRFFKRYKCILELQCEEKELRNTTKLTKEVIPQAMRTYLPAPTSANILMIDCSKEIEDLFKHQ